MFVPPAFREDNLSTLHQFIVQHSFAIVVSQVDDLPFATHIPILLRREEGQCGTLIGHFARANPQWTQLANQTGMVIFNGPNSYISPIWYEAENVVPTWNYAAVHAYGKFELIEDGDQLLEILQETVNVYETKMPQPWSFDGTGTFAERLVAQIVGFRMPIERIEGKFKLNQNHPADRRKKVIQQLQTRGDEDSNAIAKLMSDTLPSVNV